ncbi:MAG: glycosyltransferase family 2 protein, partial [Oligoflexales bacterium]|nr:glycosyltransferase family 2 protein [Oligoflexales bacterium]
KELAVVIPAYNEAEIIKDVINLWIGTLDSLGIDFNVHVYNDGSKDKTLKVLQSCAGEDMRVIVHDKENSGHGPTILQAYRENIDFKWIFQIDSDNEIGPQSFKEMWEKRENFDLLIGYREGRIQNPVRFFVSAISRFTIFILFGRGIYDVNSPYRLMRSERFRKLFYRIPSETFAPNVIVAGWAVMNRLKVFHFGVPHENRKTGEVSIRHFKLIKAAVRSFWQTVKFRIELLGGIDS